MTRSPVLPHANVPRPSVPAADSVRAHSPAITVAEPTQHAPRSHAVDPSPELIRAEKVSVFYGDFEAIKKVSISIPQNQVVAMIGPSGCGKSTFLRSINRLNDLIPGYRVTGELKIGGQDVYAPGVDLVALRRQVGLVFQKPNPFPKSMYDNVAFGPRLQGVRGAAALD